MHEYQLRTVNLFSAADLARSGGFDADLNERPVAGVRVRRGQWVDATAWPEKEREARHFIRMQAVEATLSSPPVFSHHSAAILWGLPVIGRLDGVHVQAIDKVGRRSRYGIVWHNHGLRDDDVIDLDGHLVTSLERTLFDLGCSSSRVTSVAAMDFATKPQFQTGLGGTIHGIEKDALFESIRSRGTARGCRSALLAVSFSDNRAGSPAESASRVNIDLAGFPSPQLQTALPREDGGFDYLDFDWEQFGRFGECDGDGKYVEDRYTKGLTPRQVLKAEKDREDRIRLHRPFGARWDWKISLDPVLLRRRLIAAGLHPVR